MEKLTIICVDDEKVVLDTLSSQLDAYIGKHYDIETAESGDEALELLANLQTEGAEVALVISDQLMPGMKGDEMLIKMQTIIPQAKKILLTGQASMEAVGRAINEANLYRFLMKPWVKEDLIRTAEEAIKSYQSEKILTAQNTVLKNLHQAGNLIAQESTLDSLIVKLSEIIGQNLPVNRISFMFYQNGSTSPRLCFKNERQKTSNGWTNTLSLDSTNDVALMVLDEVIQSRKFCLVSNCTKQPYAKDPYILNAKPKSILCAPIFNQNALIGLFYVENYQTINAFNFQDTEFLQLLAGQAGVAIEKARLYSGLELLVQERTQEVVEQNKIIEAKNRDILDSIQYASRIQKAIMPPPDLLSELFPDSFLFYMPKDIISGDFYWFTQKDNALILAAVDCTGHGVPGAMLSVLGANLLHHIVNVRGITSPEKILTALHENLLKRMHRNNPDRNSQSEDGMDIAICSYLIDAKTLEFAGAQRPVIILRNNELIEFKGDKFPIGGSAVHGSNYVFKKQTIPLQENDALFLYTDGITDQFGGHNKKKLTSKRLHELLLTAHNKPMQQINTEINQALVEWKAEHEQTDDILIFGVRFDKPIFERNSQQYETAMYKLI